jgi:hypothetical protein
MWNVPGQQIDVTRFQGLRPEKILYEFDGPRTFTFTDEEGELFLAHWCDEEGAASRFIVVPCSAQLVAGLEHGELTLLEVLQQPRSWIVDLDANGVPQAAWRVDLPNLPSDVMPLPGVMLLPSLAPLISVRAIGAEITPGQIPGSVIRACVEGVQRAVKVLAEYVLEEPAHRGRPPEFIQRLFDLPAQRVAFSSFEISFRLPIEQLTLFSASGQKTPEVITLEEVGELLKHGLNWLTTEAGEQGLMADRDPAKAAAILRALKELTPSSQGSIEAMELRGDLIGKPSYPIVVTKESRQRVNHATRNLPSGRHFLTLEGRVRELDKDRLSFELREIEGDVRSQRFVFDQELLEEVFQAFQGEARVMVAGLPFPVRNLAYALAISRIVERPVEGSVPIPPVVP